MNVFKTLEPSRISILWILLLILRFLSACDTVPIPEPSPVAPSSGLPSPTSLPPGGKSETSVPPEIRTTTPTITETPQQCVSVGEPGELPILPFDGYPQAVLEFLNAGGTVDELDESLYANGVANLPTPAASADFTGDGKEDVVVSIFEPNSQSLPPAGMLLIYICENGEYVLAYEEDSRPSVGAPGIRYLEDLNADGRFELVSSSARCGAHTCFESVKILAWDGAKFENLMQGDSTDLPFPTIILSPRDEDGHIDIEITGSGIGSVGAGPQRNLTRTWSYREDGRWQPVGDRFEHSNYRIHLVHDADAASERGDYDQALLLYNRVVSDTTLDDWMDPETEQASLAAYSRYRIVTIHTIQGNETFARTVLNVMKRAYPVGSLQQVYVEMASAFREGYAEGGPEAGCSVVRDIAAMQEHALDMLGPNIFGYGNPSYTLEDICPH